MKSACRENPRNQTRLCAYGGIRRLLILPRSIFRSPAATGTSGHCRDIALPAARNRPSGLVPSATNIGEGAAVRSSFLQSKFLWLIAAALVSAVIAFAWPGGNIGTASQPNGLQEPAEDMDRAMARVRETHNQIVEFLDLRENEAEARARAEAQAREMARLAAIREAEAKRELERRLAEAAAARETQRADAKAAPARRVAQKPEMPAGNPLDIVPDASADSAPRDLPRGPIETIVARVDEIKDRTVATIGGIRDWLVWATDRIFTPARSRYLTGLDLQQ